MERRRFLEVAAGACAALALGGCAAVAVTPVNAVSGAVRLPLRNFPQLAVPGGYLKIQPAGATAPLFVLAQGEAEYVVLSPICTHLGCTVNIEGNLLVCPCHGSTYDRTGRVLRGPAERPLSEFPARVVDGELIIQIEGAA